MARMLSLAVVALTVVVAAATYDSSSVGHGGLVSTSYSTGGYGSGGFGNRLGSGLSYITRGQPIHLGSSISHGYDLGGFGNGFGHGYGNLYGNGYGNGFGSLYGNGFGSGYGSGYGIGYGNGFGNGFGGSYIPGGYGYGGIGFNNGFNRGFGGFGGNYLGSSYSTSY